MAGYFDDLETRSADARAADQLGRLGALIRRIKADVSDAWPDVALTSLGDIAALPVLRKDQLAAWQKADPPFGGVTMGAYTHVFQSPGPIYEPGNMAPDWWRFGRALHAAGIGSGDIVQNCFSYHLTPAGLMFESGARAVGAKVLPAGTGQTEQQARAAGDVGTTAYAGTPDYLKAILDQAAADGRALKITKAAVSGGALFPALRAEYADRGIACRQCYGTADLGLIAYESAAMEGMIIDEEVIVEIVRPGTGDPVAHGEVGEVVVTSLNPDYPLIRFATGDLSAVMAGQSPCGRSNMRIKGWMGRADQTTKVKGMFVRPEQVADFVARHGEVAKARVVVTRDGAADAMTIEVEAAGANTDTLAATAAQVMNLKARVVVVAPGSLPNDGKVIDDQRQYD